MAFILLMVRKLSNKVYKAMKKYIKPHIDIAELNIQQLLDMPVSRTEVEEQLSKEYCSSWEDEFDYE